MARGRILSRVIAHDINFNKLTMAEGKMDKENLEEEQHFKVINGKILAHCSKCEKDYYFRYEYETSKESGCCKAPFKP